MLLLHGNAYLVMVMVWYSMAWYGVNASDANSPDGEVSEYELRDAAKSLSMR